MGLTFQLTLIGCSDHVQQCCVQLLNFQSINIYTLTVFDFYLYGSHNHVDTSQLMTILCFQLLSVSSKAILPILVMFIMLVGSSLFCIGADKGQNDLSMKKEVTLIFFLLEHCSSLVTGITHFICCGSQKTKFMVLLFLCWLLILESYIKFRLVQ